MNDKQSLHKLCIELLEQYRTAGRRTPASLIVITELSNQTKNHLEINIERSLEYLQQAEDDLASNVCKQEKYSWLEDYVEMAGIYYELLTAESKEVVEKGVATIGKSIVNVGKTLYGLLH